MDAALLIRRAEPAAGGSGSTTPFPKRRWRMLDTPAGAEYLSAKLGVSRLLAGLLIHRGQGEPEAARQFLRPTLADLHEPTLLPGLDVAAERLAEAVRRGEKVVIYGDYDVDGITATAILWHALRVLGGEPDYYIPHRVDEGYGLNADAVRQLCDDGADVIVTVDCGITAVGQAIVAKDRGVDLIVTDHHDLKRAEGGGQRAELPEALCVHPMLPGHEPYPNGDLCGAGVAFKLAWGVGQKLTGGKVPPKLREFLVEATALAGLGTVADVVALAGENRVLAHFGLGLVRQTKLAGLRALVDAAGLGGKKLDSFDVGFKLGPRLNAAGRMGHAREAVELLTTATPERAAEIARFLESANKDRQATERRITDEAAELVEANGWAGDDCRAIVVAGDGWHQGVVGIVASRLVDRFHRPTVVLTRGDDGTATGSARGLDHADNFHLARTLADCGEHLARHGGHAMAAGLALDAGNIDAFRAAFVARANAALSADDLVPVQRVDAELRLAQLTPALVGELAKLGPFGSGNPRPAVVVRGATLDAPPRCCGRNGDHLQLRLRQAGAVTKAIAFRCGDYLPHLRVGQKLDVVGVPTLNEWNGSTTAELEIRDLAHAE